VREAVWAGRGASAERGTIDGRPLDRAGPQRGRVLEQASAIGPQAAFAVAKFGNAAGARREVEAGRARQLATALRKIAPSLATLDAGCRNAPAPSLAAIDWRPPLHADRGGVRRKALCARYARQCARRLRNSGRGSGGIERHEPLALLVPRALQLVRSTPVRTPVPPGKFRNSRSVRKLQCSKVPILIFSDILTDAFIRAAQTVASVSLATGAARFHIGRGGRGAKTGDHCRTIQRIAQTPHR
jgi:hypothetical protein